MNNAGKPRLYNIEYSLKWFTRSNALEASSEATYTLLERLLKYCIVCCNAKIALVHPKCFLKPNCKSSVIKYFEYCSIRNDSNTLDIIGLNVIGL